MSETPKLCQSCAAIVEESGLHFVECGGIQNGLKTTPTVWRLRPKNEAIREAQITKDLQRLSKALALLDKWQEFAEGLVRCVRGEEKLRPLLFEADFKKALADFDRLQEEKK